MANRTKRVEWIDLAKGLAILLMIIGHVQLIPWEPYRKIIFSVHMPLFFIVAGYFSKPELTGKTVLKWCRQLLIPYLVTCLLTAGVYFVKQGEISLAEELYRCFWGSGVVALYGPGVPITGETFIPMLGAIWFLPCMFFGKVLFTLLLRLTPKWPEPLRGVIVLLMTALGYAIGLQWKIPLNLDIALFCTVFFYAGYLVRRSPFTERPSEIMPIIYMLLWLLAIKLGGLQLANRSYGSIGCVTLVVIGAIAGTLVLFIVCRRVLGRLRGVSAFLRFCGKNSLYILCIHHLETTFFMWETLLPSRGNPTVDLLLGVAVAVLRIGIAVGICWLLVGFTAKINKSFCHSEKNRI